LENKVLLLEKDLEIRDLKLATIEKTKNDYFYQIIEQTIRDLALRYIKSWYEIVKTEKDLQEQLDTKFNKSFLVANLGTWLDCKITCEYDEFFMKNFIDISLDINNLFPQNELKGYFNYFYDNFKIIIYFDEWLKIPRTYTSGSTKITNYVGLYECLNFVRRGKNDKYFFEVQSSNNKETK
jgi:hypothetical protein